MEKQTFKNKYTNGIFALVAVLIITSLVYTSPVLNQASLFNAGVTGSDSDSIYMPSYSADIGEEGLIEIKSKQNMKPFDGISFFMGFSPNNYLSFSNNPLVFDSSTLFQNVASQKATVVQPGILEVTIMLQEPITISDTITNDESTHKTLFKIKALISASAQNDEQIGISFKGAMYSNEGQSYNIEIPPSYLEVSSKKQASDFAELTVSSFTPEKISNQADATVVFSGTHLDLVNEVWIGKGSQTITNKTASSLSVKIPAGKLIPDNYYITFYDKAQNEFNVQKPLVVTDEAVVQQQVPEPEQPMKEAAPQTPTGDSPKVIVDKTYTNPTMPINDGKTPFSLYVLVEDKNKDIKSVIANLTKIGQVGQEVPNTFGQSANNTAKTTCPTGSNFIACMTPTVQEGQTGQWFMLSNLTISKSVAASTTPYKVDISVVDNKGHTDKKSVSVTVSDGRNASLQSSVAAVATSKTSVEVLFNQKVSVSTTGKGFTITSGSDVADKLNVTHATTSASGNVVTITTSSQIPDKKYVVTLSSDVKDANGKSLQGATIPFDGFKPSTSPPVVNLLKATDVNKIQLEFQQNLKLSSIAGATMKVYEAANSQQTLNVLGVKVISGKILQVQTDSQTPQREYRINIAGLVSYAGIASPADINKGFTGYNLKVLDHLTLAKKADFNNDGRVDFADFTMFASVYGTIYFGEGQNLNQAADNAQNQVNQVNKIGQPLGTDPDSLVPHTSEPQGGNV